MKKIFALIILTQSILVSAQTTIYVNQNVQGGAQNGSSWADAFLDLQQALAVSVDDDQIWVATGTYYPTSGTDRTISFVLKNGVKIFGGFQGSETSLAQRNFELHETILSGNLGLPKGSDNSYHVLYGEGLDSTTVLDGFVVTKGIANGSDDHAIGGGLLINPSTSVYNTCPIIQNCRFEHNYAWTGGGIGIPRGFFFQNYVNPIIRNCQFVSNRANLFGGGMAKIGPALMDHPFIMENCAFSKNSSGYDGGGIYFSKTENATILKNCVFEKDTSKFSSGGGVFFASGYDELTGAVLTMDSCMFKENIATEGGGFYYWDNGNPSVSIPPFRASLSDCVFEKNIATNGYGGAYGFVGFKECSHNIDILRCKHIGNLSNSNYTTFFQAGEDSANTVFVKDCQYLDNKRLDNPLLHCFPLAFGIGGPGSRLDAKVENCLFVGNGGGIASLVTLSGGGINTYISNCTFFDNNEYVFNKSFYSVFNGVDHFANTYLNNCVIWQADASVWTMFSDNNFMTQELGGYYVDHCLLSLDSTTTNFHSIFGGNNISETDPLFENAASGDFRLEACSPAVNAGNNLIVDTLGILTDLDGNPRIRFDTVDIGAYETQDSCFTISSKEPQIASISAILSPNPVSPGSPLAIQVFDIKHPNVEWIMRDAYGRALSSGSTQLVEKQGFNALSPTSSGIYFIEMRSGGQTVWIKFVVN